MRYNLMYVHCIPEVKGSNGQNYSPSGVFAATVERPCLGLPASTMTISPFGSVSSKWAITSSSVPHMLLVDLTDLAGHTHLTVTAKEVAKLLQGLQCPVRRFIEHHCARLVLQTLEMRLTPASSEGEILRSRSGRRMKPDDTIAGIQAVAPGRVITGIPSRATSRARKNPGSLIPGVPASLILRNGHTRLQLLNDAGRRTMLIELMMRHEMVPDVIMLQGNTRCAGVLGKHKVSLLENTHST